MRDNKVIGSSKTDLVAVWALLNAKVNFTLFKVAGVTKFAIQKTMLLEK